MTVQLENGYTRIANKILEDIAKAKLTATQYELLYIIWRYTYGFSRKEHNLSISFLSNAIDRDRRQIQRALRDLENRNIIRQITGHNKRLIAFNKNSMDWVTGIGNSTYGNSTMCQNYQGDSGKITISRDGRTTNQEIKKENIKEMASDFSSPSPADTRKPYDDYFVKVWEAYHNKKGKNKVTSKQKLKLYNEVPEEQMLKAIEKYKKETKDTESRYIMHGSTWFNGGYEDYIDQVEAPLGPKKEPVYKDYNVKMAELEAAELEKMKNKPMIKIKPYEEKSKELEEAELRRLKHGYDQGT